MMTVEQRKILAQKLKATQAKLQSGDIKLLLRDLSPSLQQEIRGHKTLGPITSAGLEHVYQLFNRLDFIIFDLLDPTVSINDDGRAVRSTGSAMLSTAEPKRDIVSRSPKDQAQANSELDFGPFDPRKGNS